ncbi:condensation domain-containing protein [Kitasatospora cineracea]|uniref:Condensation domain-containing protein n=1 Tax=Kitasatospora cineracea TaxID=88074 RepID=A0A3N4R926_9ACTN|nr:condensation domain-containing protein [Kitasatospora cineracea]RPE29176.1 condensation domain-containing protein [Kitasatospora cineracea]
MSAAPAGNTPEHTTLTLHYRSTAPEAEGPLTLGQDNMIRCLRHDEPSHMNKQATWSVPPGAELPACLDALRTLAERHAALRTVFPGPADRHPERQRVRAAGEFTVRVIPLADGEDPAARAEAYCWDGRRQAFDLAAEFPLRFALLTRDDAPVLLAVVICHAQLDGVATGLLFQEWLTLAAGGTLPPPTAPTPVEVAEQEQSASGQRRTKAALRHWEHILADRPTSVFADDRIGPNDTLLPTLGVRSTAGAAALERAAARTGASNSAVLLACYAVLAAHRAARSTVVMAALSANRHRPGLADHIGTLAQDALLAVDTDCPDLDTLIARTQAHALSGYWHATFDAERIWQLIEDVAVRRGARFARHVVVNDLSATVPAEIAAARPLPPTEPDLAWYPAEPTPTRLMLNIWRTAGCLEFTLHTHPDVLDREETELFAHALLRLLDLAGTRNVTLGPDSEIAPLSGLPTARRDKARWQQVGTNWIDLDAVADLLRTALPTARDIEVTWENDELIATIDPGPTPLTPTRAHTAVMAALPGHDTAMAPQRYVLPHGTGTGRDRDLR